jgi:hypothetical protein
MDGHPFRTTTSELTDQELVARFCALVASLDESTSRMERRLDEFAADLGPAPRPPLTLVQVEQDDA